MSAPSQSGVGGPSPLFFNQQYAPLQAVVPPLTALLNLYIDPTWKYATDWGNAAQPIGGNFNNFTFPDLEDGLTEESTANYATTDIVGRAEAFKTFVGTSNRQVGLLIKFFAQGLGVNAGNYYAALQKEVQQPVRWLDSLKFPFTDSSGVSHGPPPCILMIGQLLFMRVIIEQATIKWMPGWDTNTMLAHAAEVQLQMTAVTPILGNYQFTGPARFASYQQPPSSLSNNNLPTQSVVKPNPSPATSFNGPI
jgi:hypothetical protein